MHIAKVWGGGLGQAGTGGLVSVRTSHLRKTQINRREDTQSWLGHS
jgi:hypothetical protein